MRDFIKSIVPNNAVGKSMGFISRVEPVEGSAGLDVGGEIRI